MSTRSIFIIDPAYRHANGHNETVNISVIRESKSSGFAPIIYTHQRLEGECIERCQQEGADVRPWFECTAFPKEFTVRETEEFAKGFKEELVYAIKDAPILGDGALVMHTAWQFQILGLSRAIAALAERGPALVHLCLMFEPGAMYSDYGAGSALRVYNVRRFLRYRYALDGLTAAARKLSTAIVCDTSCKQYQAAFRAINSELDVGIHPAVVGRGQGVEFRRDPKQVTLYIGEVKADKGINFAVAVAERISAAVSDVKVVFHFNKNSSLAKRHVDAMNRLFSVSSQNGNVIVYDDRLSDREYEKVIRTSAVVCGLYDPSVYMNKTSGIFWDALLCDVPWIIVTKGTWMEREAQATDIRCSSVEYGDVDSAVAAIQNALIGYSDAASENVSEEKAKYTKDLRRSFGKHVVTKVSRSFSNWN